MFASLPVENGRLLLILTKIFHNIKEFKLCDGDILDNIDDVTINNKIINK